MTFLHPRGCIFLLEGRCEVVCELNKDQTLPNTCKRLVLGFLLKGGKLTAGEECPEAADGAYGDRGVFGLLLGSLLGTRPGLLGTLSLLTWTAGQANSQAWEAWKGDREMAVKFLGKLPFIVAFKVLTHWSHMLR